MSNLISTVKVAKTEGGDSYVDAATRGFMRRHGFTVVDSQGNLDTPTDADTSGARSEDLSSSGWIRGVDQGSVNRHPNTAGARQAPGASSVATQPSVPVTGTPTSAAGKSTKLAKASAQKCLSCGSVWLTKDHGEKKSCSMCGSTSLIDPATTFAKSYSGTQRQNRTNGGCNHTNSPRTQLGNGTSRCDRCGAVKGTVSANEPTYSEISKSAAALSVNRSTGTAKRADDRIRDQVAERLYEVAKKTTNPSTRKKLERFAQAVDSGELPVPQEFIANSGPVKLSTGARHTGSGRASWAQRHGF